MLNCSNDLRCVFADVRLFTRGSSQLGFSCLVLRWSCYVVGLVSNSWEDGETEKGGEGGSI